MPQTPRPDRNKGSRWTRGHPKDPIRPRQLEVPDFRRYGSPPLQGIRLNTRDMAAFADGLRSLASTRPHGQHRGRKVRRSGFPLEVDPFGANSKARSQAGNDTSSINSF